MKSKRSLFKTLFILFVVKYTVLGVLFFAGAKKYVYSSNVELFTSELQSNANMIMPLVKESLAEKNYEKLNVSVREMVAGSNKRITVIDLSGKIIADSQNDPSRMQNHLNRDEVRSVIDGTQFGKSVRYSATLQENMLYTALPVAYDGKLSAVLRISVPLKRISLLTNNIFKNMTAVFVLVGLLALAAAYVVSKKISYGISRLSKAALEVASGNLGAKVDISGNDEIGDLARSFNKMSGEISVLFQEVSDGKEMLDKVLASVSDGILLMDKEGKTLLYNETLKTMFPDVRSGRHFWEFLRSKEIENDLRKMKDELTENFLSGEFSCENSDFSYVLSKVKNEDKFVISLKDVTRIKQLDNFKKDFVTNASHELKTPVTAIIGFTETLESEDLPGESSHYVGVIKKQAQRLSNVVNDLLSLSSFENMTEADKKELNISEIINDVAGFYKKKAMEKEIEINVMLQKGLRSIFANEFNMEQLLINIVDNAVRYTEKGEITIKAENSGDFVLLTVSDTGIGIPKEHIARLFERFYVVDKSRSRKSGGTGLGLSIVKHIVQSHGGKIVIESVEGEGSRFAVKFPAIVK